MVVLWTDCAHAGAHVVDLTWRGGELILVSFFAGWLYGRFQRRFYGS